MKPKNKKLNIDTWFKKPDRCLVIAEVGSTHNGDLELAKKLIDAVADSGADVVKFQTHIAEAETLPNAPSPSFFNAEPRFQYFKRTAFTFDQWKELKKKAESRGLVFLSSSFSIEATDMLEKLGVKLHKIPSGEITNIPYLKHMAKTRTPTIMSSGMSHWKELDEAVEIFTKKKNPFVLLQCTSEYPVIPERVGLNLIEEMRKRYKIPVGLSDHSMHNYAAFGSVALGAVVVEKHITLSRDMYGSDAKHSLLPSEFKELVEGIRVIDKIMYNPRDKKTADEFGEMRRVFQKSVVTTAEIKKGQTLSEKNLGIKKPGTGIAPKHIYDIVGKKAARDLPKDYLITWKDAKK
ncbi:MAG: N-acetylneuraminate synthase [Patescibacteria group bacterium]|nr:N-acetylneuraminate synthase [Patescibacteria group bacterium]